MLVGQNEVHVKTMSAMFDHQFSFSSNFYVKWRVNDYGDLEYYYDDLMEKRWYVAKI